MKLSLMGMFPILHVKMLPEEAAHCIYGNAGIHFKTRRRSVCVLVENAFVCDIKGGHKTTWVQSPWTRAGFWITYSFKMGLLGPGTARLCGRRTNSCIQVLFMITFSKGVPKVMQTLWGFQVQMYGEGNRLREGNRRADTEFKSSSKS